MFLKDKGHSFTHRPIKGQSFENTVAAPTVFIANYFYTLIHFNDFN